MRASMSDSADTLAAKKTRRKAVLKISEAVGNMMAKHCTLSIRV
jgi:hypothetical protein